MKRVTPRVFTLLTSLMAASILSSCGTAPSSSQTSSSIRTPSSNDSDEEIEWPQTPPAGAQPTQPQSSADCADPVGPEGSQASKFRIEVCELVNDERSAKGLSPLQLTASHIQVAQTHAVDMAANDYFDHDSQDGRSPFDRIKEAGIRYTYAAENIAYGQSTPSAVVKGWMSSSGHRANILNAKLKRVGVGFSRQKWVQTFTD